MYAWVLQVVSLAQVYQTQSCTHLSSPAIRATSRTHLILFDLITRMIFGEEYGSLSSSLSIFIHSPFALSS
jgi:hypothetical protein